MILKDDFEHRLSQGLKRWAEAAEPTLDLQAAVLATPAAHPALGATGDSGATEAGEEATPLASTGLQRWHRPLLAVAAVLLVLLSAVASFPSWAGAAAGWPLVGPVVTEIILKDAGLKWAYDNGFIQQPLAEVRESGIAVRILGLVADAGRTTVIYQVIGLPRPTEPDGQPKQASGLISWDLPGPSSPVTVSIVKVDGEGIASWGEGSTWTPAGAVGTVSTLPIPKEQAELELWVGINGAKTTLTVVASRAVAGKFSREVAVDQTQSSGGVTVTVKSVIYTPVETILRYRIDKTSFSGGWGGNRDTSHYLESGGQRYYTTQSTRGSMSGEDEFEVFPAVPTPVRFVVPSDVIGTPVDVTWPLQNGTTRDVNGTPVTLQTVERQGNRIGLEWRSQGERYKGVSDLELIDAEGQAYPIDGNIQSWGTFGDGTIRRTVQAEVPAGVEPVAVRAHEAGVQVNGPWAFDLPR